MSENLHHLPAPEARKDVPLDVRLKASTLSTGAARVGGMIGRHWTTKASKEAAMVELLNVAEDALALRRMLENMK